MERIAFRPIPGKKSARRAKKWLEIIITLATEILTLHIQKQFRT